MVKIAAVNSTVVIFETSRKRGENREQNHEGDEEGEGPEAAGPEQHGLDEAAMEHLSPLRDERRRSGYACHVPPCSGG